MSREAESLPEITAARTRTGAGGAWFRLVARPVSPIGLAVFRILYGLVLLAEIAQLHYFRHLVFDRIPFLAPIDVDFGPLLLAWMVVVACLVVGWQTRGAAVVNYVLSLFTFGTFSQFEYHLDSIFTAVNLLLIFLPVSRRLALDARRQDPPTAAGDAIPIVHYHALVWVGIALVYLDSLGYKLASRMWLDGLGLWLPASRPHITWVDPSVLLDLRLPVVALGYLTLVFEAAFPLLFWWRRLRLPLIGLGLVLHLGIAAVFPIPWFGLAVVAIYVGFLPGELFERWCGGSRAEARGEPRRPEVGVAVPLRLGASGRAVLALTVAMTVLQLIQGVRSPLAASIARSLGVEEVHAAAARVARGMNYTCRILFGVTPHAIFVDHHFVGYDRIYAVRRVVPGTDGEWLPIVGPAGKVPALCAGRLWTNWCWRVAGPGSGPHEVIAGVQRFTAFWSVKHRVGFADSRYEVLVKPLHNAFRWERGHYRRQVDTPWEPYASAGWRDGRFFFEPAATAASGAAAVPAALPGSERSAAEPPAGGREPTP